MKGMMEFIIARTNTEIGYINAWSVDIETDNENKKRNKIYTKGRTFHTGEGFLALFSFFIFVGLLIAANPTTYG